MVLFIAMHTPVISSYDPKIIRLDIKLYYSTMVYIDRYGHRLYRIIATCSSISCCKTNKRCINTHRNLIYTNTSNTSLSSFYGGHGEAKNQSARISQRSNDLSSDRKICLISMPSTASCRTYHPNSCISSGHPI